MRLAACVALRFAVLQAFVCAPSLSRMRKGAVPPSAVERWQQNAAAWHEGEHSCSDSCAASRVLCVCARACACVCVRVCACMRACVRACAALLSLTHAICPGVAQRFLRAVRYGRSGLQAGRCRG